MDYHNNDTESRKNKHLNFQERIIIEIRFKDGFSVCKIARGMSYVNILYTKSKNLLYKKYQNLDI